MNSIYKSASEAAALLHTRYDGVLKGVQGRGGKTYDYIPWNESARQLDRVFGIFGWDTRVVALDAHPQEGIYTAAVEITARVLDDETGTVISIVRGAVGRGAATPSKDEREQGIFVAEDLGAHDTAAAAAGSDAFSRAAKLLGDAFGLFLYDKEDAPTATASAGYARAQQPTTSNAGGKGPSPKQMTVLLERGYTEEQVASLGFRDWKGVLDAIFEKRTPAIAPEGQPKERTMSGSPRTGGNQRTAATVEVLDEIPF